MAIIVWFRSLNWFPWTNLPTVVDSQCFFCLFGCVISGRENRPRAFRLLTISQWVDVSFLSFISIVWSAFVSQRCDRLNSIDHCEFGRCAVLMDLHCVESHSRIEISWVIPSSLDRMETRVEKAQIHIWIWQTLSPKSVIRQPNMT